MWAVHVGDILPIWKDADCFNVVQTLVLERKYMQKKTGETNEFLSLSLWQQPWNMSLLPVLYKEMNDETQVTIFSVDILSSNNAYVPTHIRKLGQAYEPIGLHARTDYLLS